MEKLAYLLKDKYVNVKEFFASPKFLRVYDKVVKALKNIIPIILKAATGMNSFGESLSYIWTMMNLHLNQIWLR